MKVRHVLQYPEALQRRGVRQGHDAGRLNLARHALLDVHLRSFNQSD
jgi:hypothetical protein